VAGILSELARIGRKEHWLIEMGDVEMHAGESLGRGSFGLVNKGYYFGSQVALKLAFQVKKEGHEVCNELQVLRRLRHPNLVSFFGALVLPGEQRVGLVLELISPGCLEKYMQARGEAISQQDRFDISIGVCRGLWFLHSRKPTVVHGDLKSQNVLVNLTVSGVEAKLVDFGLSRIINRHASPMGGTLRWMAPEVCQSEGTIVRPSSDLYSFGRLLFYVVTGAKPYHGIQREMLINHMRAGCFPDLLWPVGVPLIEAFWRPHAEECLRIDASQRPTAVQLHDRMEQTWLAAKRRDDDGHDRMDNMKFDAKLGSENYPRCSL